MNDQGTKLKKSEIIILSGTNNNRTLTPEIRNAMKQLEINIIYHNKLFLKYHFKDTRHLDFLIPIRITRYTYKRAKTEYLTP